MKQNQHYDIIIIGLGSMGASAFYYLAKAEQSVLGLDQCTPPHTRGSHTGHTRLIRKSYFEDASYVPQLEIAYQGWKELEESTGSTLYHPSGIHYFGKSGQEVIDGIKHSSKLYNIPLIASSNTSTQFIKIEGLEGYLEPEAGYLNVERAIESYLHLGETHGGIIQTGTQVLSIKRTSHKRIEIQTTAGTYDASRVIVTAGPYIKKLGLSLPPLKITRQTLLWFSAGKETELTHQPCWVIVPENQKGILYGFSPEKQAHGEIWYKMAHHYPGETTDPDELTPFSKEDLRLFQECASPYINFSDLDFREGKTCMYTYSEDEHFRFLIPEEYDQRLFIATGFSGHGFKFIPYTGQRIRDWAINPLP